MLARLTEGGVLVLTPGSSTEMFALQEWSRQGRILVEDLKRDERCLMRGSRILIQDGGVGGSMMCLEDM